MGNLRHGWQHNWERSLKGNVPVLVCSNCGHVWEPHQYMPKKKCKKDKTNEGK